MTVLNFEEWCHENESDHTCYITENALENEPDVISGDWHEEQYFKYLEGIGYFMELSSLYIRDRKGKTRVWSVTTEGDLIIVVHGILGGKLQTKTTTAKAKNVGKANETTPTQQAQLEAKAKWTKQIAREDYAEDVEDSGKQLRPMLALDYNKVPHRVNWDDAVTQPKLDGLRLTAGRRHANIQNHELMTRKGEVYNIPHLAEATRGLLNIVNNLWAYEIGGEYPIHIQAIDGEVYIHGMSLQNIVRLSKKYREGETETLKYYLFDLVMVDTPFETRYEILKAAYLKYCEVYEEDPFVLTPIDEMKNEEEMKQLHGKYVEQGYEGLMIRHKESPYAIAGRSPDLFKYKHFMDEEALITAVWEDNNGNAMLTVEQPNGSICHVTPKRTHAERKLMLDMDLVGKYITVKFQAFTEEGVYQFPVGLAIREMTENGEPIV